MKHTLNIYRAVFRSMVCSFILLAPAANAAPSIQAICQSRIYQITSDYFECLLDVESANTILPQPNGKAISGKACDVTYNRRYSNLARTCERSQESDGVSIRRQESSNQQSLNQLVHGTVGDVRGLVSGVSPSPVPGQLILYNNCGSDLKIMSPTSSAINGATLPSKTSTSYTTGGPTLGQNTPNTFMVAPITTDSQCQAAACQNWTDIQTAGQREGYMWENNAPSGNNNLIYAAYCQPTNAAAKQCSATTSSPCCGSQMNYDKTFGTTFEITPNGGTNKNQDFIDLSTNYGSGPTSPPTLCPTPAPTPGPGATPNPTPNTNNCVTAGANIFFNVPVNVTTSNSSACSFPQGGSELTCTEVSCADAYQYPEDNKQVACPSGTGYVVTFCPSGAPLPTLPLSSNAQNITIQNNLDTSSPCANGNTISLFTSGGGQQVIQPGGKSVTIQGSYASYPGLGIQVNNWYWTQSSLPVQAVNPQNPDNSGAQFTISDQCVISQFPPVYGEGIETYRIAAVTAQNTGTGCLISVNEKQPYTDAVTPGCCAPPLPNMSNVCTGPWGVTNNQQPWPPQ